MNLKKDGESYAEISIILCVSLYVVKSLVTYKCKTQPKKRDRKQKISKAPLISIKREIFNLQLKEKIIVLN